MNNSARMTRRYLVRIGGTILLTLGLMSVALAAWARPLSPGDGPLGEIIHACPDAYEADDVRAEASALTAGAPQQHNFDGNTILGVADKDWARFDVVQTGVYTLTTFNLSAQADTVIELYDASGNLAAANDNAAGAGPASRIVWTAPTTASGIYYLSVYPTGTTPYANCAGTVVSYTLSLDSKVPALLFMPVVMRDFP